MKVASLSGWLLDWAVAEVQGLNYRIKEKDDLSKHIVVLKMVPCPDNKPGCAVAHFKGDYYSPSTDWSIAGEFLDKEEIQLATMPHASERFLATADWWKTDYSGSDYRIAICRAFVAYKIGPDMEIPLTIMKDYK